MLGMQEVYTDQDEVLRFKENNIISMLVDNFKYEGLTGLNAVSLYYQVNNIPEEHYSQINQLIGYSVNGWGTLSSTSDDDWEMVMKEINKV